MKKVIFFFFFFLFTTKYFSQVKIDFILYVNNVADSEKVFITGNVPQFGLWNPGIINFDKLNDSTWIRSFLFEASSLLEFKFTKGDWTKEALDSNNNVPDNYKFFPNNDTTLSYRIDRWNTGKKHIFGQITGKIKYHRNYFSKFVQPRDIIVWLPPSYDSLLSKRYPVLYMHDGQNIIDPETSAFGVDWQIDESADSLIKKNLIEELIIVGINNTYLRSEEYSNTEIGSDYLKFITSELKPFIDNTYRTLSDCENSATAGSSMGGLISFILAWEYPEVFSKAACLSPAFKIDNINYIAPVLAYYGKQKGISFYIDNGGIGLEQALQPGIDEMLEVLKSKGFVEGENILWIKDETAEHNESAWTERVPIFLKYFFPKSN